MNPSDKQHYLMMAVLCFLLAGLVGWLACPAGAAIAYVGTAAAGSRTSGTSHAQTVPARSVDDLVVLWMSTDGAETLSVTNTTCIETWNSETAIAEGSTTGRLFWAISVGTGSCIVSMVSGTSESAWSSVAVFSGTDTTSPIGVSNTATGNSNAPTVTQTTGTTSGAWAVVVVGIDRNGWQTTDGQYPTNTTGVHSGESGDGANDTGAGLAYDTTSTNSEVYTWGTMSRSDGYNAGVYEIVEPIVASDMGLIVIGGAD